MPFYANKRAPTRAVKRMAIIAEPQAKQCGMYFSAMNASSVYISRPVSLVKATELATAYVAGLGNYCELQVTDNYFEVNQSQM